MVGALDSKRVSNAIFAGLFVLALFLFYKIVLPFVMPIVLGAFLVVLFWPVHDVIRRFVRRRSLSAVLSTAVVALVLFVPLTVIGFLVARELPNVLEAAREHLERFDLNAELKALLPSALADHVHVDVRGTVEHGVTTALIGGASWLSDVLSAGAELLVDLFLLLLATYYFFLDGRRLVLELRRLLPLDRRYFDDFTKEFKDVAHAMMYGNALTAVVQGVTGLVGLWLARVPNAALWSSAMVILSFLPVGGTALVWGPIGLALMMGHHYSQGLFVLGWGVFMVGALDNMIKPRICGAKMALHPLLVFLSMFGGITVFGMMGLLLGPLIASLFMAMVRIYRSDFLKLEPLPEEGEPLLIEPPVSAPQLSPLGAITEH